MTEPHVTEPAGEPGPSPPGPPGRRPGGAGDRSVADKGYLTLNPLRYTDAMLSIVLPLVFLVLGGIGLPGGAVWIDRSRIRGRLRHSLVSAAGPLVNIVLALVLLVLVARL